VTEQEQIALFKRVQKHFFRWTKRQCSGYVHGIVDEGNRIEPQGEVLHDQTDTYNIAYVYGFIDARGPDVTSESWYRLHALLAFPEPHKPDFQWWVKK